jgi:hypothetical protein
MCRSHKVVEECLVLEKLGDHTTGLLYKSDEMYSVHRNDELTSQLPYTKSIKPITHIQTMSLVDKLFMQREIGACMTTFVFTNDETIGLHAA